MEKEKLLKLSKPLPQVAFHKFTKEETGYDQDIISHNYQYAVNRMNEVLGSENWMVEEETIATVEKNGLYEVTKKINVIVGKLDAQNQFIRIESKWNYGGGISKSLADAHKSAVTNGLKKALALYGVGKETYEQSMDDDFLEKTKVENKVNSIDEVKEFKKKIMNCKTQEELQKLKPLLDKSRLEIKDKTVLVGIFNQKLTTLCQTNQPNQQKN